MTRALNITLRTLHIAAMAILVGGVAFDGAPGRLHAALWLTVGTRLALAAVEASSQRPASTRPGVSRPWRRWPSCPPCPWWGNTDWTLLLGVIGVGSVASHMPRRFRHYSLPSRRVIRRDHQRPAG